MSNTQKTIVYCIIFFILGAMLTWAPWLNDKALLDITTAERADKDGTNNAGCGPYTITTAPLGRWVGSCEAAYFITFWGQRI
jgi:hypothetical protein